MPTYDVMPHLVPADNRIEADDAEEAIEYAIADAEDLMRNPDNWTATEVSDDDDA